MAEQTARTPVTLRIRRRGSVADGQGNTYGIMEVSPEVDDPAILLAVRIGATGRRYGCPVRPGGTLTLEGLDLAVTELSVDEPASVTLAGTVPTAAAG